jgi:hypothetical protein
MLQSLRDALADPGLPKAILVPTLLSDLTESLVKENLAVLQETFSRPAMIYNALLLAALSTVFCFGFSLLPQQVLRQQANDPQLELAGNLAVRLEHGASPSTLIPSEQIDMDSSLSSFVIAYDEQGRVLASSGQLQGSVPALPQGIFNYVRKHGEDRVTWAPQPGVRIASIVRHVAGPSGGFVLAGRNLREVEFRKDLTLKLAIVVWIAMLGTIATGTFLFGWFNRTQKPAAA